MPAGVIATACGSNARIASPIARTVPELPATRSQPRRRNAACTGESSSGGVRQIVGFVGMFLSSGPTGDVHYSSGGGSPWCAQYYGIWNKNGQTTGAGKPGIAYVTVMVQ